MTRIGPRPWERVRARSLGRHERREIARSKDRDAWGGLLCARRRKKGLRRVQLRCRAAALIRWKFVRKSHGLWSCCCFHIDILEKGKIFAFAPWFIHTSFTAFASGCLFYICQDGLLELDYWSIPDSGVLSSRTSFILFYPISLSSRRMRKVGLKTPFESFSPSPGLDPVVHPPFKDASCRGVCSLKKHP